MDLLYRYLKQIERYLPFKERKETLKELESLILDQVDMYCESGMSKEDALYQTVKDMGEPREVASRYNESRPMFSREMEPILMLVLKIVSVTLPLVILFARSIEFVFATNDVKIMDFLLNIAYTIPSALSSLLVAYGFIFMIFFLIERYIQPKFEVEKLEFNPNLLPKIPAKMFKVSIVESIITILVTCLALYLFNMNQGLIAVYYDGGTVPLLNENFDGVLMFMNVGWFISIALHVYYLFKRRKTIGSKTVEGLHQIYSGVVLIVLAVSDILNRVVLEGYDLNFIPNTFKIVFIFIGVAVIIGSIVEYVKMFINLDALEELSELKDKE